MRWGRLALLRYAILELSVSSDYQHLINADVARAALEIMALTTSDPVAAGM